MNASLTPPARRRFTPSDALRFLVLFAAVWAFAAFWGCAEKDEEDVDTSSASDDDDGDLCGRDYETEIAPFFETYCLRCHSVENVGDERNDAPDELNYDTQEDVVKWGELILEQLGPDGEMPPSPPVPDQIESDKIIAWLTCVLADAEE